MDIFSAYSESFKKVECTNWEYRRDRATHQLTNNPGSNRWTQSFTELLGRSWKKKYIYCIWPIPIFRPNWTKCIVLTTTPCLALCSVSGQRIVLWISFPIPPDVDLSSSMTNQFNGCRHFLCLFFRLLLFFLKINCDNIIQIRFFLILYCISWAPLFSIVIKKIVLK